MLLVVTTIPIWHGTARQDGGLGVRERERFMKYLSALAKDHPDGREIEVIVRVPDKERSLRQNAFFHGIVLPLMADAAGYQPDEMKKELKKRFGVLHTSQLSTKEFATFLERCNQFAAESLDVILPDPRNVEF